MSWTMIEQVSLTSSQASVTLGSGGTIPQGYKTLKLLVSIRADANNTGVRVRPNNDSGTNYAWQRIGGDGASATSDSNTTYGSPYNTFIYFSYVNTSVMTASTFSNGEIIFPNYASTTQYKPTSSDHVSENNATAAYAGMIAGIWNSNSAITSLVLTPDGTLNWVSGSTFTLYALK